MRIIRFHYPDGKIFQGELTAEGDARVIEDDIRPSFEITGRRSPVTTHGVRMAANPPRWLRPGDNVTVEIERIGRLTNPVAEEILGDTRTTPWPQILSSV